MRIRSKSPTMMVRSLLLLTVVSAALLAEEPKHSGSDGGATDLLSRMRNELTNRFDQLGREAAIEDQIEAVSVYERQLAQLEQRNEISASLAADEWFRTARKYWDLGSFHDATRVGLQIIDKTGDSKQSARTWFMLGMMQHGNFSNPTGAVEPFENANAILARLTEQSSDREILTLRSNVLNHTGDLYGVLKQPEQAIECYREILTQPKLVDASSQQGLLNASLELARSYQQLGDIERAAEYYDAARQILESPDLPSNLSGMAISVTLERIRSKWARFGDPERIKALEKLWASDIYKDDPRIFQVGNELTLYYFFAERVPTRQFYVVERQFLERIRRFVTPDELPSVPLAYRESLVAYYGQNLLLYADANRMQKDKRAFEQTSKEFKEFFAQRTFQVQVPTACPREAIGRITSIHEALFGKGDSRPANHNARLEPIPMAN